MGFKGASEVALKRGVNFLASRGEESLDSEKDLAPQYADGTE